MPREIKLWLSGLLFCLVMVPVGVFLGGWLLAGPYEGDAGIFGLMGAVYNDALLFDMKAWVLLTSPVLLIAIWVLCVRLNRRLNAST